MSVPNFKRMSIRSKVIRGSKNFEIGHVTKATLIFGSFYDPDAVGDVLYVCSKFEADISIRSKVIRGSQNFEVRSRDQGHAHLRVILWSARRRGSSSMSVPNLSRIPLFVQKLLGSQNSEISSRDPGHAHFRGRSIIHTQGGSVLYVCTKFEADCSISLKVIRGVPTFGNWVT